MLSVTKPTIDISHMIYTTVVLVCWLTTGAIFAGRNAFTGFHWVSEERAPCVFSAHRKEVQISFVSYEVLCIVSSDTFPKRSGAAYIFTVLYVIWQLCCTSKYK